VDKPLQRSAVAAFAAEPTSATAARRFVRQTLTASGISSNIADRAELIVSELVTNAVLHAGAGPVVSIRIGGDDVRIEVEDTSATAPVMREYGLDASTGRGLRVVSTAASEWGVHSTAVGKSVWARLSIESLDTHPVAPAFGYDIASTQPPMHDSASSTSVLVTLSDIPVDTYMELETHNESLAREFSLLQIQAEGDDMHVMQPDLRAAVIESADLDIRFTTLRIGARAARVAARQLFSIQIPTTTALLDSVERYTRWSETTDSLSERGLLLTAPSSDRIKQLRSWLVCELVRQARDGKPSAPFVEVWRQPQ
jgi:anti-sigma regulatory factor (Ser/Thr protein kinase)